MSSSFDTKTGLNDCGCGEGVSVETPASEVNRPGLSALAYRVGTHSQFKETLLARLSGSAQPALNDFTTRDSDDFSIALLDAWATVGDVLTFYQERVANEAYLRTATERLSVMELARLINYQLSPGVAASTYLAFTLEDAHGALGQTLAAGTTAQLSNAQLPPLLLDIGTKVQSVPAPGETAQTFETVEKIETRPEWNGLKPRLTKFVTPAFGDTVIYVKGITSNLKVGDMLLFVGEERLTTTSSDRWDARRVSAVDIQVNEDRTRILLDRNLGTSSPHRDPAAQSHVFVFRSRASVFGYNAPDWRGLPDEMKASLLGLSSKDNLPGADPKEWPGFTIFAPVFPLREKSIAQVDKVDFAKENTRNLALAVSTPKTREDVGLFAGFVKSTDTIDLDNVYSKISVGGWVLLTLPNDPNASSGAAKEFQRLFQVSRVTEVSRSEFLLSAKVSRVVLSGPNLDDFKQSVRTTAVFVESEELELAEVPTDDPVWKSEIVLDRLVNGLQTGRKIIVTGKCLRRIRFNSSQLPSGEFFLLKAPQQSSKSFNKSRWYVIDSQGQKFFVEAAPADVTFLTSLEDAEKLASELAIIDSSVRLDEKHTRIILASDLANVYDAATVVISANVALATQGETTSPSEVLGGGDATKPYQKFVLKQPPLTHVSSSDSSGAQSTLEVRVNDVLWHEVRDFYDHEPSERIYVTRLSDDGKTTVIFGDGDTGARLPTGQENIKAKYRKGIGLGGLVKADQLTQLMSRPLGLKSVTNPLPSSGAADPEKLEEARRNAPLTVLTLERVVSLKDYENFASGFSGIGKALATLSWFGEVRGVFLTIAGANGAAVDEQSPLFKNLLAALRVSGDPLVAIKVKSYQPRFFSLRATITVDPDFLPDKVKADVDKKLREAFSFDAREFGQSVHLSEVISVMQNVEGVVSIDVDDFYRSDQSHGRVSGVPAAVPQPNSEGATAAELLLIDNNGIQLEVSL